MKRQFRPGRLVTVIGLLFLSACGGSQEPTTQPAQLDFGVEMARRGLWNEALFRFQQANRHQPGNPRILNNMAVAYEALGQFDDALSYYQDALKSSPGDRELRRNYSRFVEFYRAFKPDQQQAGEAEAETDS